MFFACKPYTKKLSTSSKYSSNDLFKCIPEYIPDILTSKIESKGLASITKEERLIAVNRCDPLHICRIVNLLDITLTYEEEIIALFRCDDLCLSKCVDIIDQIKAIKISNTSKLSNETLDKSDDDIKTMPIKDFTSYNIIDMATNLELSDSISYKLSGRLINVVMGCTHAKKITQCDSDLIPELYKSLSFPSKKERMLSLNKCSSKRVHELFRFIKNPTNKERLIALEMCNENYIHYLIKSFSKPILKEERKIAYNKCSGEYIHELFNNCTKHYCQMSFASTTLEERNMILNKSVHIEKIFNLMIRSNIIPTSEERIFIINKCDSSYIVKLISQLISYNKIFGKITMEERTIALNKCDSHQCNLLLKLFSEIPSEDSL